MLQQHTMIQTGPAGKWLPQAGHTEVEGSLGRLYCREVGPVQGMVVGFSVLGDVTASDSSDGGAEGTPRP